MRAAIGRTKSNVRITNKLRTRRTCFSSDTVLSELSKSAGGDRTFSRGKCGRQNVNTKSMCLQIREEDIHDLVEKEPRMFVGRSHLYVSSTQLRDLAVKTTRGLINDMLLFLFREVCKTICTANN